MYMNSVREHFMMALDIRNPGMMDGSIVGTTVALAVISGVIKTVKLTTESVLTGDLASIPSHLVAGVKEVARSELEILEAIKPSRGKPSLKAARYNKGKRGGSR